MSMTTGSQWRSEYERADGLRVQRSIDGWLVMSPRGETLNTCPCCDKPLLTARAARLVADFVFPVQRPAA